MAEQQHTPEPYDRIVSTSSTQIHSDDGIIAEFSCCDHKANARRWLACVNACKGIETKDLEFVVSISDDAARLGKLCNQAYQASHKKFPK